MTQRRATINSLSSTKRQTGAEYLLHDSGAQLHACPIKYPGKKNRCMIMESTQRVELASNITKDETIRVLSRACEYSPFWLSRSASVLE